MAAPQVPKITRRWLWAEIALVDEDGVELDYCPRMQVTGTLCASHGSSTKSGVTFSARLRGDSVDRWVATQFLGAVGTSAARTLKISVRADWPILQNFQLQIGS